MLGIQLALLLSLGSACLGVGLDKIHVDPITNEFVDTSGRVRLFHGINSVIKGFPWYDPKMLDPGRQAEIARLGINVIRLGVMWTGVVPEEGQVNETYINILEKIVSDFADLGIYTLFDMHQDVLWQAGVDENEGYWGVPPWIKHKLTMPDKLFPWPMVQPKAWECGYFTKEISQGFGQLYENVNGVADDFANFWKIVAERFKSFPSVLGYELINEPGAGDVFEDLSLLLPGIVGAKRFQPLYERASEAIRQVDDETIIFWEPALYSYFLPFNGGEPLEEALLTFFSDMTLYDILPLLSQLCGEMESDLPHKILETFKSLDGFKETLFGEKNLIDLAKENPSIFGPGFDYPPGGPNYRNRTAMSWHYYCWGIYQGSDEPYDFWTRFFCDKLMGPTVFNTVKMRRKEVGSASFLTEFGVCYPNISNPDTVNSLECNAVLELAEKTFESWTYWDTAGGYTFWDGQGQLVESLVKYFSRPYPMSTSGTPKSLSFDLYTATFRYEFYPDPALSDLPTEIFVPYLHYPERAFEVTGSQNIEWSISPDNEDILQIFLKKETFEKDSDNETAFITFRPTQPHF